MSAFFVSDAVQGVREHLFRRALERGYLTTTYDGRIEVFTNYCQQCGFISGNDAIEEINRIRVHVRVSPKVPLEVIEKGLGAWYRNTGFLDETCNLFYPFFTDVIDRDLWGIGYNFSRKYNLGKFYLNLCTPPSYEAYSLDDMRKEFWMIHFASKAEARIFIIKCDGIVDVIRRAIFRENSHGVIRRADELLNLIHHHSPESRALIDSIQGVKSASMRSPSQVGVHRLLDKVQTEMFFLRIIIEENIANGYWE